MRTSKSILSLFIAGLLLAPSWAIADQPVVNVNATATVSSDTIMLGDIATITPSPMTSKASATLAAVIVGRAPLRGLSRPLNMGNIRLKLRASGIDPNTVNLIGAQNLVITEANTSGSPAQQSASTSIPSQAAQSAAQKAVKFGDPVDVLVIDGPVTVHAKAYATQSGSVGDAITVRRDGVDHLLLVTVIGAGQVQLEE